MNYELHEQPEFIEDGESVSLIASHRDQVRRLPPDARVLLSNTFCPLAGFQVPGRLLALQGHPEFTRRYALELLDLREGGLPADAVAGARHTLASETPQGPRVGRWIRRFVEDAVSADSDL
jgi:GMP synthase (glutamine-hydrolysing)